MVLDSFLEVLKRIWREFDRSNRTGSKEFSGYVNALKVSPPMKAPFAKGGE